MEPQLCSRATAAFLLLQRVRPLCSLFLKPTTAIAASAATAGTTTRKPTFAFSTGLFHLTAQGVLRTQPGGAPPGTALLKILQSEPPHWYCPYLQQRHEQSSFQWEC